MIWADFNARTQDDLISLETKGSKASLASIEVKEGDTVWLTDGEICVKAKIEKWGGKVFARPDWWTLTEEWK